MSAEVEAWALPRLSRLLGLDDESLAQIVSYALSLPKPAASEHLTNLLGDSGPALEFIASFNQRRPGPPGPPRDAAPPAKKAPRPKKNFNALPPPRRVAADTGAQPGYMKPGEADYMSGSSRASKKGAGGLASALALHSAPELAPSPPRSTTPPRAPSPAPAPSKPAPKAKAKANIAGGPAMRGPSSNLADLDSAIRQLEAQTNPVQAAASDARARRCACQAQRHPLLAAAPNCLACGKIVCAKEGLGACTWCGAPLLSRPALGAMLRALKDERGRARQAAHNGTATPPAAEEEADGEAAALARARAHRDRLLAFQAQNARRTTVRDEAADFETPDAGLSAWASPAERALQLKRQQRVLREQSWAARPEFEKRRMVVSLDVKGGKAVRRFEEIGVAEGVAGMEAEEHEDEEVVGDTPGAAAHSGGGFARNPLLGALVRPVWTPAEGKGKGRAEHDGDGADARRTSRWRRVQDDDDDDNERWILDGGAYGGHALGAEEMAAAG